MPAHEVTINTFRVLSTTELTDFDEIADIATLKEKAQATQAFLLLCLLRSGVGETQVTVTGAKQLRSLAAYDLLERYHAELARGLGPEEGFGASREYWRGKKKEEKDLIFGTDPPAIDLDPATTDKPGGEFRAIGIGA